MLNNWNPKTEQGRTTKVENIIDLETYFNKFYVIPESQIIDYIQPNLEYILIKKRRVQRTTKSGKQASFSVLVAVGNKKDCVGLAFGNSAQLKVAIQKGVAAAKKKIILLQENKGINKLTKELKFKSSIIKYKPGRTGMGLVAGPKVRQFLQLAGIKDVYVKLLGSKNPINYIVGLFKILQEFKKE